MLSQKLKAVLGLTLVVVVMAGCGAGVKTTQEKNDVDKTKVEFTTDEDMMKSYTYPEKWEWEKPIDSIRWYNGELLIKYRDVEKKDQMITAEKLLSGETVVIKEREFNNLKYAVGDMDESSEIKVGNQVLTWVKDGLVSDYNNSYEKRFAVYKDGILVNDKGYYGRKDELEPPCIDYYNITNDIMVKKDEEGNVLWKKIYLYYLPGWDLNGETEYVERRNSDLTEQVHYTSFYYFRSLMIFGNDREQLFLLHNWEKLYRIDENGMPHTNDPNLIVMDYEEYKKIVQEAISEMLLKKIEGFVYVKTQSDGLKQYMDYDYIGQKIAEECHLKQLDSEKTKEVLDQNPEIYDLKNAIEEKMEE